MLHLDDQTETLHIYVAREEIPPPLPLLPIILSALTLFALLVLCLLSSNGQPDIPVIIRVPAVFPPIQNFRISVPVIPTGRKTFPATCAHGLLTITNGTVISQTIPAGFTIDGVATDSAVFVPAGSAIGYGITAAEAHALTCGKSGNYPAYTLNYTLGAGVYIRNLTSFQGGKDSYAVALQLPKDRQTALDKARNILFKQRGIGYLVQPCQEKIKAGVQLSVAWTCQFYTYNVSPLVHILHARLTEKTVIVDGYIVERPRPFVGK
jgi:hypothetical protein